jgi:23S rRNA (cytosine1962-C5)-methyltransferase
MVGVRVRALRFYESRDLIPDIEFATVRDRRYRRRWLRMTARWVARRFIRHSSSAIRHLNFPVMAGLVIKPRARILHGHDWVFSSEVLKAFGKPQDGDVISLKDGRDHLVGSAIYNSKSQIVARRFSRRKQGLDLDFFQRRIEQAVEYRSRRNVDPQLCRLVWSESDGLPGVIVDRLGDVLVLQTLTLGMDQRKELIVEALASILGDVRVVERNDAVVRRAEGLDIKTGMLRGPAPSGPVTVRVPNGPGKALEVEVDLMHGQKTGFYLDQVPNYPAVSEHARDRRVLDCFTGQGGFALACAQSGAAEVTGVEGSGDSLAIARANAHRNGLAISWIDQDVFQFLRSAEKAKSEYDLIILDPPSFTRTKGTLRDALRGYRELHLRAFMLLSKNGMLATFSCSHHVNEAAFQETTADALVDARRSARRLRRFEQALDHPVLPTIPETEYFKGFLLEMMPGR